MRWPGIQQIYGEFLKKTPVFSSEKRWEDLHMRVIEHVGEIYVSLSHTYAFLRTFASYPSITPA